MIAAWNPPVFCAGRSPAWRFAAVRRAARVEIWHCAAGGPCGMLGADGCTDGGCLLRQERIFGNGKRREYGI